jgi:hypothetical protein
MNRTNSYKLAIIIHLLFSLFALIDTLRLLPAGAEALNQVSSGTPPYFVVVAVGFIGALGLVSAYGAWYQQKWGIVLTIVLRAIDGLLALPGVLFAVSPLYQVLAGIGVMGSIVVIFLILTRRPAIIPIITT